MELGWQSPDQRRDRRGRRRLTTQSADGRLPPTRTGEGFRMQLATYLFFATDCEAALAFYADCGLGRVVELVRYGEGGAPATGPLHGKILHACFEGPGVRFYASDNADAEPMRGFANFVMLDDHVQTRRLFERMILNRFQARACARKNIGMIHPAW